MDTRTEKLQEMQRKSFDRGFKDGWKCGCEMGCLVGMSFVWVIVAVVMYRG